MQNNSYETMEIDDKVQSQIKNESQQMHNLHIKDAVQRQKLTETENELIYQRKVLEEIRTNVLKVQTQRQKDCQDLVEQEEVLKVLKKKVEEKQKNLGETFIYTTNGSQNSQLQSQNALKSLKKDNEKISENLSQLVKTNFEVENFIAFKFDSLNQTILSILELKDKQKDEDLQMNKLMSNQLKMYKRRVQEKDDELKKYVELKLKENQKIKDEITHLKQELNEQIEESIADDLKIFKFSRDLSLKQLDKDIDKEIAKEKARMIGGEQEALKVEEDFEVRQSRAKAQDILTRMKAKLERLQGSWS